MTSLKPLIFFCGSSTQKKMPRLGCWEKKEPDVCKMAQDAYDSIQKNPLTHDLWKYRESREWMNSLKLLHQFARSSGLNATYIGRTKRGLERIHDLHKLHTSPTRPVPLPPESSVILCRDPLVILNRETGRISTGDDGDKAMKISDIIMELKMKETTDMLERTRDIIQDMEMADTILPFMEKTYEHVLGHARNCKKCGEKIPTQDE